MKLKKFNEKYEKKLKKIDKRPRRFVDVKWVLLVTLVAYLISLFFSGVTEAFVPHLNALVGVLVIFIIIIVGVLFDMIGVAVRRLI